MVNRVRELASPYIPANAKQKGAQIDRSSSRMIKHVRVRFCFVPELVCYVLIRRVQFFWLITWHSFSVLTSTVSNQATEPTYSLSGLSSCRLFSYHPRQLEQHALKTASPLTPQTPSSEAKDLLHCAHTNQIFGPPFQVSYKEAVHS